MKRLLLIATLLAVAPAAAADTAAASAEAIYNAARPSLLQIRTLLKAGGGKSSLGSGFVVGDDGLALTNYHVVSQYALEPDTYRMDYAAPDGHEGGLSLIAVDVANDIAVVKLDQHQLPALHFDPRALRDTLPRGERLYSMGNPLDLGFTIVEGTYNGPLERSYTARLHFTGAINPGMSGGPTVAADGSVVGINVSKRLDGELVSFLVPAKFAAALLNRARDEAAPKPEALRAEVGRQLTARQSALYQALLDRGFRSVDGDGYRMPEADAPWFSCWSRTNDDELPKPRVHVDTTNCSAETSLFVADDITTGSVSMMHMNLHGSDVNAFQFAHYLSQRYGPDQALAGRSSKQLTSERCHDAFVSSPPEIKRPLLRAAWCARGYRDFDALYDVSLTAVTQDRGTNAALVRLIMRGVPYDDALRYGQRFLETLQWTP